MFKITIEEITQEKKYAGKEWKIIETVDGEDKRGYTPEIEKFIDVNREVYKQMVDELDLVAVINAINQPQRAALK